MISSIKTYCTLGLLALSSFALAQQSTLQVVTKNITRTIDFKEGFELSIDGEKADVQIDTWDKEQVKVVIDLIAKNENLDIAKKDLESMQHNIEVVGKKIFVRNYRAVSKGKKKTGSIFKAIYVITIPEDCPVDLRNHFGKANITGLTEGLDVKSEFCEIQLENIKGSIGVETRFGDLEGTELNGPMRIEAVRSDITLTKLTGPVDIRAKYGKIKIDANNSLLDLNIIGEKTDIVFLNAAQDSYSFDLTANYGNVDVPSNMDFSFTEKSSSLYKAELNIPKQEGMVSIQTSFGNIVVMRVE